MLDYLRLLWLLRSPPALFSRLYSLPWYHDMLQRWAAPLLSPQAKILEVGCAGGDFAKSLSASGAQIWAVDRSARMLQMAQQHASPVQFQQADATSMPFLAGQFDVVLAASLLNVVSDAPAVIAEMQRVCRPGGWISVLVPDFKFTDAAAHRYCEAENLYGFNRAAFLAWHRLARKMDIQTVARDFKAAGMTNILVSAQLGGMVGVIAGQRVD